MKTATHYMIQTEDAENPCHDGRKKYGKEAIKEFKKGSVWAITELKSEEICGVEIKKFMIELVGEQFCYFTIYTHDSEGMGFFEKLSLVDYTPTEEERFVYEVTGNGSHRCVDLFMEVVTRGIISVDKLHEICDEIYKDEE